MDDKKKSVTSQIKAEIDAAESKLNILAENIRNKSEYRYIKCTVKYFPEKEIKEFYSVETGELIDSKKMESEDFQLKINLDGTEIEIEDKAA